MVMTAQPNWRSLDDEALLERRISGLGLRIEGMVADCIGQLYRELEAKGLALMPPCHIGDEWFCPEGCAAIFIPFYLFDDRLRKLERKMVLEVEGGTRDECMKLLRHEAGHAYSYAYKLQRKKKWQQHFGLASQEYPETYRPRGYSRSYVVHLDGGYAQMHPDEDWAETFAVWLAPGNRWRRKYAGWPALRKLEYVEELMESIAGKEPVRHPEPPKKPSVEVDVGLHPAALVTSTFPDLRLNIPRCPGAGNFMCGGSAPAGWVNGYVILLGLRK